MESNLLLLLLLPLSTVCFKLRLLLRARCQRIAGCGTVRQRHALRRCRRDGVGEGGSNGLRRGRGPGGDGG